MLILIKITHA